jgi:orotidine-5'-phosphate decarboxylase
MTYAQRLQERIAVTGSALCVGIDPRLDLHPSISDLAAFCERVIEETAEHAAAFKPNIAYFEALGVPGYELVESLIATMKSTGVPVILDAKRGDIGTTQEHYAKAYFDLWDVDAVTLSPYMGYDSVEPFLQHPGKGVYLLGVTTNVSADVLARMPDVPLLIPGLGAQGGDLETLRGADRKAPSVINVSRGILYADTHLTFAEKARDYANRIAEIA